MFSESRLAPLPRLQVKVIDCIQRVIETQQPSLQGNTWDQVALLEGHESEVKGVAWSSSGVLHLYCCTVFSSILTFPCRHVCNRL